MQEALEWYIGEGCLIAEAEEGEYKISKTGSGFNCRFEPYPVNLTPTCSGFIIACIQACEKHFKDSQKGKEENHGNII